MSVRFRYGNLLTINDVDVICHQVNCLTVRPHGLSLTLSQTYPWGDIYKTRKSINGRNLATKETRGEPGTITIFEITSKPAVACLQAQWDYGKCSSVQKRKILPYSDTPNNREMWFKRCMQELGRTPYRSFAFPFKIGCGLAGGSWTNYLKMIKCFAIEYKRDVIIIVPIKL